MIAINNYHPTNRLDCIDIFRSNLPTYFASHELQDFKDWIDQENIEHYFVLGYQSKIVGCGGFYLIYDTMEAGFAWGMIHQNFHNQGLGKKLSLFRLKKIKEMGPFSIRLSTSQHTAGFYEKMGFKTKNVQENGFGQGLDKYEMSFEL